LCGQKNSFSISDLTHSLGISYKTSQKAIKDLIDADIAYKVGKTYGSKGPQKCIYSLKEQGELEELFQPQWDQKQLYKPIKNLEAHLMDLMESSLFKGKHNHPKLTLAHRLLMFFLLYRSDPCGVVRNISQTDI